jgi:hypothetical protein
MGAQRHAGVAVGGVVLEKALSACLSATTSPAKAGEENRVALPPPRAGEVAAKLTVGATSSSPRRFALQLQRGRFFLYQPHNVLDHFVIIEFVVDFAGAVDHAGPFAAAGEADVGVEGLAWAVYHAANDGERERFRYMGEALFQRFDGADHVKALAGARWARDDVYPAMAQAEGLQNVVANAHLVFRLRR